MPCQSHWQATHKRASPPPKAIPKWKIQNENSNYEDHVSSVHLISLRASNFCVKRPNKRRLVWMPCQSHWQTTHKRAPPPPKAIPKLKIQKMKTAIMRTMSFSTFRSRCLAKVTGRLLTRGRHHLQGNTKVKDTKWKQELRKEQDTV